MHVPLIGTHAGSIASDVATRPLAALWRALQLCSLVGKVPLRIRLFCSFLRTRLRLARGVGSLLLPLFLHNAVRVLAFPLPLPNVAIGAVTLAFPLTSSVLIERSFLRPRLRLARGIRSLLLPLFLHNAVRVLAFPLPLPNVAIGAATLAFPPD
jgi:hypothetical protein